MKKNLVLTGLLLLLLGLTYLLLEWWPKNYGTQEDWLFSEEDLASLTYLCFGQSNWRRLGKDFYLAGEDQAQIRQDWLAKQKKRAAQAKQTKQTPPPTAGLVASWWKMDDILGREMALVVGHLKIQQELAPEDVEKDLRAFFPGDNSELPALTFTAYNATTAWQLTLGHQLNYAESFYVKFCVEHGVLPEDNLAKAQADLPGETCRYLVVAEEAPLDTFYFAQEGHRSAARYQRVRRFLNAAPGTLLNHDLPWPPGKFRAGFVYYPLQKTLLKRPLDQAAAGKLAPAWQIWQNYGQLQGFFIQFADHPMLYELDAKQVSHWQEFWQNIPPADRPTISPSPAVLH